MKEIKYILSIFYIVVGFMLITMGSDTYHYKLTLLIGSVGAYIGVKLLPLKYNWSLSEKKMIDILEILLLLTFTWLLFSAMIES